MMDGYLTAIVVGPFSILPDKWFHDLLGERGRIATATGKTMAVITAVAGRFNVISESLSTAPESERDALAPNSCFRGSAIISPLSNSLRKTLIA